MSLDIKRFFQVCNPAKILDYGNPEDRQYYIDFCEVRGSDNIKEIRRTIMLSGDEATCQLFTGHIGCGKSTELSRLKAELEKQDYHVVYFQSSQDLDMADVDISDILLAIARQISQSLEAAKIRLQPTRLQNLLQGAANLLNSDLKGFKLNIPQMPGVGVTSEEGKVSLAFGIGELTAQAKDSKDIRALLRQHLEPRVNNILAAINQELIITAKQQLQQQGKAGLVVIIDNLDRIDNKPKTTLRMQPEYLFVDRGEQLNELQCHVIYTIPLVLAFSNDKEQLTNRFGSYPQLLPMVRVQNRDGTICEAGLESLRQMILARAFPDFSPEERLNLLTEIFDSKATLDRLCQASGGHVRNLLVLLHSCLKKDDPPFESTLIEQVISQRCGELSKAITPDEWELLRQVKVQKTVRGEDEYQTLLKSLFVFEYRDENDSWFDINPVLASAEELSDG
ncbi:MAG: AAA family ATPase [Kamptonema sp. SIO1D9]|nr:AAA family ATPase [Kamptonema sp. SIO1D9]